MALGKFAVWNQSSSSADRSLREFDASNRIFDGFFTPQNLPVAPPIERGEPLYAMGSCFAREIEAVLGKLGFNVVSMDMERLSNPLFTDGKGVRTGFFHRFNIPAMEIELRRAFDDVAFDEASDLLAPTPNGRFADLNYWPILDKLDLDGTLERRRIGREMTRAIAGAKAIVLTLGLTEAWVHKPSGMYCNGVAAPLLAKARDAFSFRRIGFRENYESLLRIYDLIERKHESGDYTLFVTVSPVPLQATFSEHDVVVANLGSKATLRTVAEEFCQAVPKAIYFPSYEIAQLSHHEKVWRPDRLHIARDCVRHITQVFIENYTAEAKSDAA